MIVSLRRPSPQVPIPSPISAIMCYEASAQNIKISSKQMETGMVDITWIFLLAVFQSLNTILWSISYPEVRAYNPREEVEESVDAALDIIVNCRERWPGTAAASDLYSTLSKACLKSYDANKISHPPSSLSANSPSSLTDANSPSASEHSSVTAGSLAQSHPTINTSAPQFGYVFDQMPEQIQFDYSSMPPPQPAFRSNSIFGAPSSRQSDRRFSYFPPEFTQPQNLSNAWNAMPDTQPPQSQSDNPAAVDPIIADESNYTMNSAPFSFGTYVFGQQDYDVHMRQGSLSQQQQIELMQSLETDGLTEIDNFMNHSAQYDTMNSIKL